MITYFDFMVSGYIKSNGYSQQVKVPITITQPSLDMAVVEAKKLYFAKYEFELSTVQPLQEGLERNLEYKESLKLS